MKRGSGSGSADHESAAMSHGGGSNDRDVITSELNAHSGSRSPSNSHSHSASHSHSSHSHSSEHHSSELTSDEVPKGCVWDKSGCINGLCDEQAMEDRCNRLNHDKDQCEGELGQLNRCEWYHGVNYSANKHKAVLTEEEVELEAMAMNGGGGSHSHSHSQSQSRSQFHSQSLSHSGSVSHDSGDSAVIERLGCVWDQTGCANGCDQEAMDKRCDRMSHDQAMCEGEIGQFNRCRWSHGANPHSAANLNADVHFADFGEDSTLDILLIIAGVVTAVFIIQQLYRWWRNREYKEVRQTQHHEEIQITSHAI